jgi:hypothetical protein
LAKAETDKDGQLLAIQLARIALAMPHPDQDALNARVLDLPQPLKAKRELLAAIVLDGQVLDVNPVMQAVDEWLAEASRMSKRPGTRDRTLGKSSPGLNSCHSPLAPAQ